MTIGDQEYTYYAFISYKREDEKWAKWLEKKLESFGFPVAVRKENPELPSKIYPVFRDQSDLTGGNLNEELEKALRESKYLIVVCSPRAARSPWVSKEVQWFIDHGRENCIIPYIIGGTPNAADPADECFPEGLRQLTGEREILGVNVNDMGREAAMIKIVARMFGLRFDTLWQSQQRAARRRRRIIYAAVTIFALLCLTVGAIMFHQNKRIAEENWRMMENRARAVAEQANRLIDEGDTYLARTLLLEVLPTDIENPDKPYVPEAEAALRRAVRVDMAVWKEKSYNCPTRVAVTPDGSKIAMADGDGGIKLWDAVSGVALDSIRSSYTLFLSFNPDGNTLTSWTFNDSATVWDFERNLYEKKKCSQPCPDIKRVLSPDGKRIARAAEFGPIQILDAATGECLDTLSGHTAYVTTLAYSPDGKYLASGGFDRKIIIWDTATGESLYVFGGHNDVILNLAFFPDGKRLVSCGGDGRTILWNLGGDECMNVLTEYLYKINSVAVSPDGKRIATAGPRNMVQIWDIDTRICRDTLRVNGQPDNITKYWVESVAYSPDGKLIASADSDGNIRVWDAGSGDCIDVKKVALKGTERIAFNSDGRLDTVSVYAPDGNIVAFSPDGKSMVSDGEDGMLSLWDTSTGICIDKIMDGQNALTSVTFTPDGRKIVGGGYELFVWNFVPLQELIDSTRRRFGSRGLTAEERRKYYLE